MTEKLPYDPKIGPLPSGVFAATVTPLNGDFMLDIELLVEHVRWLLAHGCDGVALFGTTGEANSLSFAERMTGLDALVEAGVPPRRLLVGTGGCALAETVALTRHAVQHHVGGVLMLPPFYYKSVTDDGLFAFYDRVIQQVGTDGLAVYLYHIPPVSQVALSHGLIARLVSHYPETVAGLKDSGGDFEHTRSVIDSFPDLRVFAGTERFLLDTLRAGGEGCISATANVSCGLAARVSDEWLHQDDDVDETQARLTAVRSSLEPFPMIAALKVLVARRTGIPNWRLMCPPLEMLDDEVEARVRAAVPDDVVQ